MAGETQPSGLEANPLAESGAPDRESARLIEAAPVLIWGAGLDRRNDWFSPSWAAFSLWSRVPEMSGLLEVRRGASVLAQVAHPGAAGQFVQ